MSYFRNEKHTSEMSALELYKFKTKLKELGCASLPKRTKKFVSGVAIWYKGHGKLVSKQVYWIKHWHTVYCNN